MNADAKLHLIIRQGKEGLPAAGTVQAPRAIPIECLDYSTYAPVPHRRPVSRHARRCTYEFFN